MKQWKKAVCFLQICCIMFACLSMTGCTETAKPEIPASAHSKSTMIICTAEDFAATKGNWSLTDAQSVHTDSLAMNEKYYIVFMAHTETDPLYGCKDYYTLEVSLNAFGSRYYSGDALSFDLDNVITDGSLAPCFDEAGTICGIRALEWEGEGYIAIPFTPRHAGKLYIDHTLQSYYHQRTYGGQTSRVSATVMNSTANLEAGAEVTISNLSYGIVSQEVYESGQLEEITDLSSFSQIESGRNYLVLDFDITSETALVGDVYCGIYIRKGAWTDVKVEQANTSKGAISELDGGQVFDFSYSTPQNSTKRIRTVLSFTTSYICSIDFEFYVYGDQVHVNGTTQYYDSFTDVRVSRLKYRLDEQYQIYYVAGYETMTDYVIIPSYHQGYPVVGIDEYAFSNCYELTSLRMSQVEVIGQSAFSNCGALEKVDFGESLVYIGDHAFDDCNSLRNLYFPESTRYIGAKAFADSHLLYIPEHTTWTGPDEYPLKQGDSAHFSPRIDVGAMRYALLEQQEYDTGDFERYMSQDNRIINMVKNNRYYLVVDMEYEFYSAGADEYFWFFRVDTPFECTITLKEVIGPGLWGYQHTNNTIALKYGKKTGKQETARLVLEIEPTTIEQGTLDFGVVNIMDDSSYHSIYYISFWKETSVDGIAVVGCENCESTFMCEGALCTHCNHKNIPELCDCGSTFMYDGAECPHCNDYNTPSAELCSCGRTFIREGIGCTICLDYYNKYGQESCRNCGKDSWYLDMLCPNCNEIIWPTNDPFN